MGIVTTMGRDVAEHVGGTATVGFQAVETDAYGLVDGVDNGTSRVVSTLGMPYLPSLGVSVGVTVGQTGDYSISLGWSEHLGIAIELKDAPDGRSGGGLVGLQVNLGVSTPNPVSITDRVSRPGLLPTGVR